MRVVEVALTLDLEVVFELGVANKKGKVTNC